jgi:hypothetical protein
VIIRDATVAADYVASLSDHYQDETPRPWDDVADDVRRQVQAVIEDEGAFTISGDLTAFICSCHRPASHRYGYLGCDEGDGHDQ